MPPPIIATFLFLKEGGRVENIFFEITFIPKIEEEVLHQTSREGTVRHSLSE
jgi:hypothetical protein